MINNNFVNKSIFSCVIFAADYEDDLENDKFGENGTYYLSFDNSLYSSAVVLNLGSESTTLYHFKVSPDDDDADFKLNVVLESMTCITSPLGDPPLLKIQGQLSSSIAICQNISYPDFGSVNYVLDGGDYFDISLNGNWNLSSAIVVVTIYTGEPCNT